MRHLAWLALLLPSRAFAEVATIIKTGGITDVVSLEKEGTGFAGYLTTAHAVGVAAVAAIAVVMIVWGAIGIFGENVWGKTKGKERVQNAILGLLLAAGSYVILKTISESLVSADFTLSSGLGADSTTGATMDEGVTGSDLLGGTSAGTSSNRPSSSTTGTGDWSGYTPPAGASSAEKIASAAEYAATNKISSCSGPDGGASACVYMGRQILDNAGVSLESNTDYTPTALGVLQSSSKFDEVSGGFANAQRGDIVISPTGGNGSSVTGHIGFVVQDGGSSIVSNSSKKTSVQYNYDSTSWSNRYSGNGIYIFRAK